MNEKKLTRRNALKLGIAAGAGVLGYSWLARETGAFGADDTRAPASGPIPVSVRKGFTGNRPNIVLILCDDLGSGDAGCYGNHSIRTPNIDALARQGVRFTDFYASASICTPSRAGLLTGRYAIRSGLTFPIQAGGRPFTAKIIQHVGMALGRLGIFDLSEMSSVDGIPSDEITVARALKVAGYRTMAIGKWHLGDFSCDPQYHPLRHGFDEFYGTPQTNDELPNPLYRNETMLERDIGLDQARLTGLSTSAAVQFIERTGGSSPFFLYLAYHAPHLPLYATERFKDKSNAGIYGDVVEELDWGVGEVMRCLHRKGLDENTIVLLTSDNGPWYNGRPAEGLRGRKGESFEGGFRAPLIARWPGRVLPGSRCDTPAMNIDIFPTLLSIAGLTMPSDRIIDGSDITGLITGREVRPSHEIFYFYHHERLEGVRAGDWKYFRHINHYAWPFPVDRPTTPIGALIQDRFMGSWPNLYNLARDEGENYDLASRFPDKCREMESAMTSWENSINQNRRGWTSN